MGIPKPGSTELSKASQRDQTKRVSGNCVRLAART